MQLEIKNQKSNTHNTDIVILGAGIGGYETFRALAKLLRRYRLNKRITIIDQNNYFTFIPLLHEVASGAVEPTHAAMPLRELTYRTPHRFLKATVQKIDPEKKIVTTDHGEINYDYGVIAMGSAANYYGVPGAEKYSYHVRTLGGAMRLRHNLIEALEGRQQNITLTVVGGGNTGVEVAGQFADLITHDLKKLYSEKNLTLRLVQTGPTLTPQLPPKAQRYIWQHLERHGVTILANTAVKEVKQTSVVVASTGGSTTAQELASDFTIWCAGFGNIAHCFFTQGMCTTDHRIPTTPFLHHPSYPTLYAVGDIGLVLDRTTAQPLPQLGEVAYHEGRYVGHQIVAQLRNKKFPPFRFRSKGILMPLGERDGLGIIGPFFITGILAWWLRRTVYLLFMPGILRKLRIVVDWTLRLFGFNYIIAVERNQQTINK